MPREIGGYLELEHFYGKEYHEGLLQFNLGRTALVWLLGKLDCKKLYIPVYNCDSVKNSVENAGFAVELFNIDENLRPVWNDDFEFKSGEWLYVINYYGQLTAEDIQQYYDEYEGRIIVDNAQAYFEKPIGNIPTIYSCRKFLGVSDGAYLSAPYELDEDVAFDKAKERALYLMGRLEDNARDYYSEMLRQSDTFAAEIPKRMSLFTSNILRGIDYERVMAKRLENYRTLEELLPSDNPFKRREPLTPFAYPYYHEGGVELRKKLAANSIFVPTNWTYLINTVPAGSLESEWSQNVLPLPIDQRYDKEDMIYMAEMIRGICKC